MRLKQFSVTTVLGIFTAWHKIPSHVLKMAIDRGNAVHAAAHAYQSNIFYSLPEDYQGYFMSFLKWFERHVETVYFTEKRFSDPALGFNGKPDLGVKLKVALFQSAVKPAGYQYPVVDLKTGQVEGKTWRGQGAAYMHLTNLEETKFDCTIFLQLNPQGGWPKVLHYSGVDTYAADFAAFLSALNAYRYFKC